MSKTIKEMIVREYKKRFHGASGAVLVEIRGMDATTNNNMRTTLLQKQIRVSVVKNTLARKAFEGTQLEGLSKYLVGPTAVLTGAESAVDIAREIVAWAKEKETLQFKGACIDGVVFEGKAGVERLSKFPTRVEALSNVVTLYLSPAKTVVGAVCGPGRKAVGIVKEIQRKLEAGETIAARA
jgi:large subunit ribosomal protein L10